MRLVRLVIALLLFVALVSFARAEDSTPAVTPEATEAAVVITDAAPVVTAEPAPAEELSQVVSAYREAVTWIGATLITVLVVLVGVVGGLIKTNATIAKYAAENIPQSYFDKARDAGSYAEGLAKTLTPNWQGDDKVVEGLKKQLDELRAVLYPATAAKPITTGEPTFVTGEFTTGEVRPKDSETSG